MEKCSIHAKVKPTADAGTSKGDEDEEEEEANTGPPDLTWVVSELGKER